MYFVVTMLYTLRKSQMESGVNRVITSTTYVAYVCYVGVYHRI